MGRNGDESNYPNYRFVLPASYRQRPEIGLIPISPHFPPPFPHFCGDRNGQFSIRINDRWRICFEWRDDGAHNVEIVDYH